jgi:iron complex outermembrane receptor protein
MNFAIGYIRTKIFIYTIFKYTGTMVIPTTLKSGLTLRFFTVLTFFLCLAVACLSEFAHAKTEPNLLELDLEALGEIIVTSVSKKAEPLFNSASAVHVINQEDIRRSGASTLPEVLRMVPGIEVSQIDGNKWAVTARGFNELFANKLLVLMDGRSIYTPLFSGVYWDVQDTHLDNIERIEVIRGPGGTLWGANAVNGVINIITKHAKDSQGKQVVLQTGTQENGEAAIRFGDKLGEKAYFRANAKYYNRGSFDNSLDQIGADGSRASKGDFRIDWKLSEKSEVTFQGGAYSGESDQRRQAVLTTSSPFFNTSDEEINLYGGYVQAHLEKTLEDGSEVEIRTFYDQNSRDDRVLGQTINTFDLDFHHRLRKWENHDIIWGLGQRIIWDELKGTFSFSTTPEDRVTHITSTFIQDEISLLENKVRLTIGSKFEMNSMTDFEFQPNIRLAWHQSQNHMVWGAVSRAVRTPSRVEDSQNLVFTGFFNGQNNISTLLGDGGMNSEKLVAFELGYRFKPEENFSIDIATFFNSYDDLKTAETRSSFTSTSPSPSHTVNPRVFDNKAEAEAYGVEVSSKWKPYNFWELNMGFTWMQLHLHLDPTSTDSSAEDFEGSSPEYRFHIRSYLNLPNNWEFDSSVYYVDSLPSQSVDSYVRLDLRLGWKPIDPLELSLSLQNILDPHPEFGDQNGIFASEVPRTALAKLTYRF